MNQVIQKELRPSHRDCYVCATNKQQGHNFFHGAGFYLTPRGRDVIGQLTRRRNGPSIEQPHSLFSPS